MKSGTVGGQDNPLTITRAARLDAVTKEVVMTSRMVQTVFHAIAEPVCAGLSPELREKPGAAARAACARNDTMRPADEARQVATFEAAGIVISPPDMAAFRAGMKAVCDAGGKSAGWPADRPAAIFAGFLLRIVAATPSPGRSAGRTRRSRCAATG